MLGKFVAARSIHSRGELPQPSTHGVGVTAGPCTNSSAPPYPVMTKPATKTADQPATTASE